MADEGLHGFTSESHTMVLCDCINDQLLGTCSDFVSRLPPVSSVSQPFFGLSTHFFAIKNEQKWNFGLKTSMSNPQLNFDGAVTDLDKIKSVYV